MSIKYIFHISDIHIMEKNYVNINHSFGILINTIKTCGVESSLLVIAGDIFESKSFLNTDDIYQWKVMCLILKKENIKTLIMCGNHDYNINSELVRDNVSLLTLDCQNIICVNKTGIINGSEFGAPNLEFYIFSPIDKLIPIMNVNSCIKIAMLHEPINHAIYDNGEGISDGRFSAADLSQYDYVLLGDIHLTQFLTDRIAYCGSFVQKTKGEGISKGYILWDLTSGVGTFVEIPLKELYIKIEAYKDMCELPIVGATQIVRHTSLLYSDCTPEFIENLKIKINKKYNYINRIVNNTKITNNKDTKNTIDSGSGYSNGHEIIINNILKDNPLLPKILNHHNDILRNRTENNFTTYKLNYLYFSNVFCYGDNNFIDFNEFNNNLVMLNGKNKEGKSSIIDIIIRVLFNECERGFKEDIVNKSKNKGFIKISFNIGHDEYTIEQLFNRSSRSQQHRLYKNNENITCDTMINTYKFLREKIGLGDYKDFVNMTTALQNRKFLVDMAQKDFISLLTKITNIDILKDVEDETKKKISVLKSINKKIDQDINQIPDIKIDEITELKSSRVLLEKTRDDALEHINLINAKLIDANRDYNNITIPDDLSSQVELVKTKLLKYNDFTTKLLLPDVEKKHWMLTKVIGSVPTTILNTIMANDYSGIATLNRSELVKQIKLLTEITYKPTMENIRSIVVLETIQKPTQELIALERCEITELKPLDPTHENEQLILTGLPNYDQIRSDFTSLKIKIEQFNSNFGSLSFNSACNACSNNTSAVKKIFDIDQESAKLHELKLIYDMRKINKQKLVDATTYKKNLQQNDIFKYNMVIREKNVIISKNIRDYNNVTLELREAHNKVKWLNLQVLEKQLNLFKEADIQNSALELKEINIIKTYLVSVQEYKSLMNLTKIKNTNGTSLTCINKLNALSVLNNTKLTDANKKLSGVLDTYRVKQNHYTNRTTLVKSYADNMAELDFNELYLRVVNCKTGIPSYVLKNTCLRVQDNCNKILQKIADFTIFIEYEKEIKIYTIESDVRIPAALSSGYQRFLLDLIFRITLTEISSISSPRMLFVDEGFGCLDRENFISIATILQKLKYNFDSLIIISHITELRNYVDLSINITRKNYLSNVQYGTLTDAQRTIHLLTMTDADDNRVTEFKEKVKRENIDKKSANTNENNKMIAEYCAARGGIEKLLFVIGDDYLSCLGCRKNFFNKKGFQARHAASETHKIKHNKYIMTLISAA